MNPLDEGLNLPDEASEPQLEEGKQYSIRPTEKVARDLEAIIEGLSEWNGTPENPTPLESVRLAQEWFEAYEEARMSLANYPQRCPRIPEQRHFSFEIRHLLFRRAPHAPSYRLLFVVEEGDDGPLVRLVHIRHGSRRPITRKEAGEMPLRD